MDFERLEIETLINRGLKLDSEIVTKDGVVLHCGDTVRVLIVDSITNEGKFKLVSLGESEVLFELNKVVYFYDDDNNLIKTIPTDRITQIKEGKTFEESNYKFGDYTFGLIQEGSLYTVGEEFFQKLKAAYDNSNL